MVSVIFLFSWSFTRRNSSLALNLNFENQSLAVAVKRSVESLAVCCHLPSSCYMGDIIRVLMLILIIRD